MLSRYGMCQFFSTCSCLSSLLPSCCNPSLTLSLCLHAGDLKIWARVNLCSIVLLCSLAMVDWLTYLPRETEGERCFYILPINAPLPLLSSTTYSSNLSVHVFLRHSQHFENVQCSVKCMLADLKEYICIRGMHGGALCHDVMPVSFALRIVVTLPVRPQTPLTVQLS